VLTGVAWTKPEYTDSVASTMRTSLPDRSNEMTPGPIWRLKARTKVWPQIAFRSC